MYSEIALAAGGVIFLSGAVSAGVGEFVRWPIRLAAYAAIVLGLCLIGVSALLPAT